MCVVPGLWYGVHNTMGTQIAKGQGILSQALHSVRWMGPWSMYLVLHYPLSLVYRNILAPFFSPFQNRLNAFLW